MSATLAFLCLVTGVHDADTIGCASGRQVRIVGIEANELRGGCHIDACPPIPGPAARDRARALLGGRMLRCRQYGVSYQRVVASCTLRRVDVGCTLVRAGLAVEWPSYRRRYGLRHCRRSFNA